MLRNNSLKKFSSKKFKPKADQKLLINDPEYLLFKNRPISKQYMDNIPMNKRWQFVDDILGEKESCSLLFSSTKNKELQFLKKSYDAFPLTNRKKAKKIKIKYDTTSQALIVKKKKEYISSIIDKGNERYNKAREEKRAFLRKKINDSMKRVKSYRQLNKSCGFYSQGEIDRIEYYLPQNQSRIKDFRRTFNNCYDKLYPVKQEDTLISGLLPHDSKSKKKRNNSQPDINPKGLPDVKFDVNNVYSRLYHNKIFLKHHEVKIHYLDENSEEFQKMNEQERFEYKLQRKLDNKNHLQIKNVISNEGQEFMGKVSLEKYNKCFLKHSGGPGNSTELLENKNEQQSGRDDYLFKLTTMVDKNGNTVLHNSIQKNALEFVNYFLDKNMSPNTQNKYGDTPLHFAMKLDNPDIISLLLSHGGDITIKNMLKQRPYDLASYKTRVQFKLDAIMIQRGETL